MKTNAWVIVILIMIRYCTGLQVNCVVMKGLNDDEICDFVSLTEEKVSVC